MSETDGFNPTGQLAKILDGECPDCGHDKFLSGPEAGLTTNIKCEKCGATFNVCPREHGTRQESSARGFQRAVNLGRPGCCARQASRGNAGNAA